VLWAARDVLAAFLASLLFAYLMERPVRLVQRWTGRPGLSIAVVYSTLAAVVGGGAWLGASAVSNEMDWLRRVWMIFGEGAVPQKAITAPGWRGKLMRVSLHLWSTYSSELQRWIAGHAHVAVTVARVGFWAVVVPILSIWIVRDKPKWIRWLAQSSPEARRQKAEDELGSRADRPHHRPVRLV
jgi:predicted PurR-regulated permease PerM